MSRFATALGLACLLAAAVPAPSQAKDCGGAAGACACGDRVVASTTLSGDLNGCDGDGLTLVAGVLDCDGRQVSGPGDRTDTVGIRVAEADGAEVHHCSVRNFGIGVYVDAGSGNRVRKSVLFSNRVGLWLGDGTNGNRIEDNEVRDNRDEGMHVGSATSGNEIARNTIVNNRSENLNLLETHDNVVSDNFLDRSKEAAILLKHASGNTFLRNTIGKRAVLVRGASAGNVFEDTIVGSGRFTFKGFEDDDGVWTFPHDNVVRGGTIAKASTCFEFIGAYGNRASSVRVDTCRAMQEREAGGSVPTDNVVHVVRTGDEPAPEDEPCADCSGTNSARGSIRFGGKEDSPDALSLHGGLLVPAQSFDPATSEVEVTLANPHGVVFHALLPAGSLAASGRSWVFEDSTSALGGVRRLQLRAQDPGRYSFTLAASTDLDAADEPDMTLTWRLGADEFAVSRRWREHARGWNLR